MSGEPLESGICTTITFQTEFILQHLHMTDVKAHRALSKMDGGRSKSKQMLGGVPRATLTVKLPSHSQTVENGARAINSEKK